MYPLHGLSVRPKRGLTLSGNDKNALKSYCLQRVRPLFGQALSVDRLSQSFAGAIGTIALQ